MSIFSKRSKSKEPEQKSKPTKVSSNGVKPSQPRSAPGPLQVPPGSHKDGPPLSPAEWTAQRAAQQAASRKRMNMDGTGSSANGSASVATNGGTSQMSVEAARPVKTSTQTDAPAKTAKAPRTLLKLQKNPEEGKKSKSSVDTSSRDTRQSKPKEASTGNKSAVASVQEGIGSAWSKFGIFDDSSQKSSPPATDCAPVGHIWGQVTPKEEGQVRSQVSADSGYGSVARSSANNSRTGSDNVTPQVAKSADLPRVDSGIVPTQGSGKEAGMSASASRRKQHEDKSLLSPATTLQSKVSGYVSRLDPGPSGSEFSSPVSSPDLSAGKKASTTTSGRSEQSRYSSQAEYSTDRGRSNVQKSLYATAPSSPVQQKPKAPFAQPARSNSAASNDRGQQAPAAAMASRSTGSSVDQTSSTATQQSRKSAVPEQTYQKSDQRQAPSRASVTQTSPYADSVTLKALQASEAKVPFANPVRDSPPPLKADTGSKPSSRGSRSSVAPAFDHRPSESVASGASTKQSAMPPISALEGYKVNKRGQILDEEGDVIGELFEGDLIDCVRQKVNREGEVLDEFGTVVGRVRPVQRGSNPGVRYSIDSQAPSFQVPAYQQAFTSNRRDSNVSQIVSPMIAPNMNQNRTFLNPGAPQPAMTPVEPNNGFVAELDASAETEAFPVLDHSEIFIPTFGSSARTQSPSQLIKPELPATERTASPVPETPVTGGPRPKKWASRYFDQGDGPPASPATIRRNSQSPAGRPTPARAGSQPASRRNSQAAVAASPVVKTAPQQTYSRSLPASRRNSQSLAAAPPVQTDTVSSPRSASANGWSSPNGFKAILGPTLEDLAEESPSRSLSRSSQMGRSTPNLTVARPASTSPAASRRASLQGSTAGLAPYSTRASYQPSRRSPLASYETTPPGSGDATLNPAPPNTLSTRSVSQRASASVPQSVDTTAARDSEDGEDSAPAPEIPKAKPRPAKKGGGLEVGKAAGGGGEKRKSFFSLIGRRGEATAAH